MKTRFILLAAISMAWLGWHMASPKNAAQRVDGAHQAPRAAPPTTTSTEPAEVFQKAFWKRPTPDDRMIHAERREWKDANGVSKWQWLIEVQPSPALLKHLRDDNAFGLLTGRKAAWKAPADWFPKSADGFTMMQSVSGSMTLLIRNTDGRLYATDSGGGFTPGAPAPSKVASMQTASTGRLPAAPPPKP